MSLQGFFVSVFYCFLNSEVRQWFLFTITAKLKPTRRNTPIVRLSTWEQVRSAVRKRWIRWQDRHSIRSRVVRATSLPTSPSRVSFHSIKQSSNLWHCLIQSQPKVSVSVGTRLDWTLPCVDQSAASSSPTFSSQIGFINSSASVDTQYFQKSNNQISSLLGCIKNYLSLNMNE